MIYEFDRFQVDEGEVRLSAGGSAIPLEPKVFRVLLYLIENPDRLIRKQELLNSVWQDENVTENALTRAIGVLRKALEDDSRAPRFIETVPTAGYRFIGEVRLAGRDPVPEAEPEVELSPPLSYEKEGAGARGGGRIAMFLGCAVLLVAGVWMAWGWVHGAKPVRTLAVLPLENLSGDEEQEYFASGMTDELITELARIKDLRVTSRTSVMQYKGSGRPLRQIAADLHVDTIVEGSILRSNDRVRITARLIDAKTDRHLWANSFEGPLSDTLGLQDKIAAEIATQTRSVLMPRPAPLEGSHTIPAEAQDDYLRGRYFFQKQQMQQSAQYFEQAIAIDPGFASAYAGLADALDGESAYGLVRSQEVMPRAMTAAERAVQLDPRNGEAYTALGSIETIYAWNWTAAAHDLKRGLELSPEYPLAEMKYAVYLDAIGSTEEAVRHMRRAEQLDPLSFFMVRRLGATLYLNRQYDEALKELQRAAEMEPAKLASVSNYISKVYEMKGMRDEAVEYDLAALDAGARKLDTSKLKEAYQHKGWVGFWAARVEALRPYEEDQCFQAEMGTSYMHLGDMNRAFVAYGRAVDQRCIGVVWLNADPTLDPLRRDARYHGLLRRINLE